MIYYKLWQSFFSSCHECFRELRDSKQREQTVCHFLLLHSVYIVSWSFLSERAELKKAKQVWITSGKAIVILDS